MTEQIGITTLTANQFIDAWFLCTRKERLQTRTGTPYLAVTLADQVNNTIETRVFRNADVIAGGFDRGDVVRVCGKVERFRDALQIDAQKIERSNSVDPHSFLPQTYRDLNELNGFLEHIASQVHNDSYQALLTELLHDDELRSRWQQAPCTATGHHAYLGGLLEHTVAVSTLANETCDLHRRLNSDLLLTAAIVHDIGKINELTWEKAIIELSEAGKLVGHIELGLRLLSQKPSWQKLPEKARLLLSHCILTHHGVDRTNSQATFRCPEAVALYRINALDAQVKGVLEHHGSTELPQ